MKHILKKLKGNYSWETIVILSGFLFIGLSISIGSMLYQSEKISLLTAHQKIQSNKILDDLQTINNQIQTLSKHNLDSSELNKIKNEIDLIKADLSTKSDITKVSSQIMDFRNDMDMQMNNLAKDIAGGINKTYLDAKVLPFTVSSIDVISGKPFITVDYQHHQSALQVGDSLVNWKIISADYQGHCVEFQNDKNQLVKITLP